ncbi:MAG TPA: pantoate--beta-alanine ligase [Thermoanaerobaculia bacterium]
MITVRELPALRDLIREARAAGRMIGFVPTMGALHEGHLSLLRLARRESQFIVVSIFVNPLQFAPGEDFERYPRRYEQDAKMLEAGAANVLYLPDVGRFYSKDFSTHVDVDMVSEGGEGAARPGHFRGVATVVAKLFLQVAPDVVCLGHKDLQQVAVIRRMVRDLDFPIRIIVGETVRESDGLALSSRNAYLTEDQRKQAALFPKALFTAQARARAGEHDPSAIERMTRDALADAGFSIDYVDVVEPETMKRPATVGPSTALAAAVRLGKTRLIDNVLLLER